MLNNEDTVSVINNLIEISKDGEEGFFKSAQDVDNEQTKTYLILRSNQIKQSVYELQNLVRELGGRPADSTSTNGYLHGKWIELKAVIMAKDNLSVLNELERGEQVALHAYAVAAKKELPPEAAAIVLNQLNGTQRNHNEVKEMRDAAEVISP
ncbi:MAG: PA2169 family four-helix-bundle protein [Methylophilaceae bacterium]|nr:PA2169 family four-helix-bundle protein [Methylophilaceae bacterium]